MKRAIIIGAGPAGITAAYEFLEQTDIVPTILEATKDTGGLSQTINYKGNRIDIGGHRFFSKSKRVMDWWLNILPLENTTTDHILSYQDKQVTLPAGNNELNASNKKMMVRNRLSRILFAGKLFNYPLKLNFETARKLGFIRITKIGLSYIAAKLFPIKKERSLEDFFINRFGKELYVTFFRDYTEKVWGVPCRSLSPDWGRQRIKGLSLSSALLDAIKLKKKDSTDIDQTNKETSLIEKFLYPQYGPGQLWETAVARIKEKGGQVEYDQKVKKINSQANRIISVTTINPAGEEKEYTGDHFISSMPVVDLINALGDGVPEPVKQVAAGLIYRDFIIVGMLVKELKLKNPDGSPIKDNWIYIQESHVKLGRLQLYNNWSPFMVADPNTFWLGLEYFCNAGDELWNKSDEEMITFAKKEIASINIIEENNFLDAVVVRMPRTYPSYTGSYIEFETIKKFTDSFENLFLVGRNGMHKYNNQDHSMLTAMLAVENIKTGVLSKKNIWAVNSEDIYHEE